MDVLLVLVHTNIMPQSMCQYFYASVILNIFMCALCVPYVCSYIATVAHALFIDRWTLTTLPSFKP